MNTITREFSNFTGTQPVSFYSEQESTCIALHKCVGQVIDELLSRDAENSNKVYNDVLPGMMVSTNKQILASIVASLLDTILLNSENNKIYISAKLIGNITLIHVRSSNAVYGDSITGSMQKLELLAEILGGCLTVSNNKMNGLTLAFTFFNH